MEMLPIIIGIIFVGLAWWRPKLALWLTIFAIPFYIIRFEVFGIPTTLLEILIYANGLAWGIRHLRWIVSRLQTVFRPFWGGLLLLAIGLSLGVVVSGDPRTALGIIKGWFIDPLLLYFLVVQLVDFKQISGFLSALLASSLLLSGYAVWQVIAQQFITIDGRASAWFSSPNYLSLYLVPVLVLGLIVLAQPSFRSKLLASLACVLGLVAIYFSFSYGGWLALILAGLGWAFLYRKQLWKWWLAVLVAPGVLFISQLGSERFIRMLDLSQRSSASVRLQVWQTALLMIKENWLTGIGLGQFQNKYLLFAERLFHPPFETIMLHSHNLFLQFILETGVAGLAGFVWVLGYHIRTLFQRLSGPAGVLGLALGVMLVHGLIDVSYWKNDLSALLWLILAMIVVWNRQGRSYEE
ncbi:MAG: O-antigen ligase family protein [Patescibacteria group bacterium]|nr:O-antigen ligase family protein [Patescibacteria group bacterium]